MSKLAVTSIDIVVGALSLLLACAHAASTRAPHRELTSSVTENPTNSVVEIAGKVGGADGLPLVYGDVLVSRPFYRRPAAATELDKGRFSALGPGPGWFSIWIRGIDYQPSESLTFWADARVTMDVTLAPAQVSPELHAVTARARERRDDGSFGPPHDVTLSRVRDGKSFTLNSESAGQHGAVRLFLPSLLHSGFSADNATGYVADERGFWTEFATQSHEALSIRPGRVAAARARGNLSGKAHVSGASAEPMRTATRHVLSVQNALVDSRKSSENAALVVQDRLKSLASIEDEATRKLSRIMLLTAAAPSMSDEMLALELRSDGLSPESPEWGASERGMSIFYPKRSKELDKYLGEMIAGHENPGVVAMGLLTRLYIADRENQSEEKARLMRELQSSRFDDTVGAWQAHQRFSTQGPSAAGQRPPPLKIESLEGPVIDLAAYTRRDVLVSFWATWCSFCRAQMEPLHEAGKASGAPTFVFVSFDTSIDTIAEYRVKWPLIGTHGIATAEQQQALMREWGFRGVPWFVLIGPDGVIKASGFDLTKGELGRLLGTASD